MKKENEIIQMLWIGKHLSLMEQLSIKSFLANGHTVHLYAYSKINGIPPGALIKEAREILPEKAIFRYRRKFGRGSYAGFANLFRYKLLLEKGGIWSDSDMVCLKPLDFDAEYVFASEDIRGGGSKICVALIKVPCGCRFIKKAYEEASKIDPRRMRWNQSGSELLSLLVDEFRLRPYLFSPGAFCAVPCWEVKRFIEPNGSFSPSAEMYAVHLWHEMWKRERKSLTVLARIKNWLSGVQPINHNTIHSPQTLYGKLQQRYL
jgi:hypothetical protein